jgi:ABC-2 type transport system permease protein
MAVIPTDDRARAAADPTADGLGSPEWGGFDPARARGRDARDHWRSFRTATHLGWLMEANWTDPFLFFIYSVAKPLSAALILVAMVEIVSGGADPMYRAFVVVGTALWSVVLAGIAGLAWSILDDRERYRMLRYVYVSPSDFQVVLLGRGVARLAVGAMGAFITIAVGVVLLGVPFDPLRVDWLLLVVDLALGLWVIVAIGMLLAAICLQTRQESWSYPEALAGALFLVSGVVFPLAVLPSPLQAVGLGTPLTWWIEGVRHAAFPDMPSSVGGAGSLWSTLTGTAAPDAATIIVALLATGAVVTLAATGVFRVSERRAKDRGLLDQTTGS